MPQRPLPLTASSAPPGSAGRRNIPRSRDGRGCSPQASCRWRRCSLAGYRPGGTGATATIFDEDTSKDLRRRGRDRNCSAGVGAAVLRARGKQDVIPVRIALVVGVHLFPVAAIIGYPLIPLIGALVTVAALAAVPWARSRSHPQARLTVSASEQLCSRVRWSSRRQLSSPMAPSTPSVAQRWRSPALPWPPPPCPAVDPPRSSGSTRVWCCWAAGPVPGAAADSERGTDRHPTPPRAPVRQAGSRRVAHVEDLDAVRHRCRIAWSDCARLRWSLAFQMVRRTGRATRSEPLDLDGNVGLDGRSRQGLPSRGNLGAHQDAPHPSVAARTRGQTISPT
jgi:hypothetical protein